MKLTHKVLLVTSSGGGGLLQAARAKQQEIVDSYPNAVVLERDVMLHWMWRPLGRIFVYLWNRAQMRGDVRAQSFFGGAGAVFAEYIFWPHIFVCSLYILFKEKVDRVIDTQIFGTTAILKAIRIYNRHRGKNVVLEKVLVDLPTKKATHFFLPIRALSNNDRKHFRLVTIAPLLQEGESEEEFWKKNCKLTANELLYEDCYVRRAFRKYRTEEKIPEKLFIRTKTDLEKQMVLKISSSGSLPMIEKVDGIEFKISSDVCVFTLLLGSQPASNATMNYIQKVVEAAKKVPNRQICFFAFTAEFKEKQDSLFSKVFSWIDALNSIPSNLTLIPMSFQQDDVIAPLFTRSNATCTRSGGQTAMELMSVARGKIWIHSEAKGAFPSHEELLQGIPGWESENAVYLEKAKGASLVTPEIIAPLLDDLFKNEFSYSGA